MASITELIDHAEQAAGKLADLTGQHLPAIAAFLRELQANPVAASLQAVAGVPLTQDALAVINGIQELVRSGSPVTTIPAPAATVTATPAPVTQFVVPTPAEVAAEPGPFPDYPGYQ